MLDTSWSDKIQLDKSIKELNDSIKEIKDSIKNIGYKVEGNSNTPNIDIVNKVNELELRLNKASVDKNVNAKELRDIQVSLNAIQNTLAEEVCPTLSNGWWFTDGSIWFSGITNGINLINTNICKSNTLLPNLSYLSDISVKIDKISEPLAIIPTKLDSILNALSPNTETQKNIIISYPSTGFVTLQTGITSINFYTGLVKNPDNTTSNTSDSLETYGIQYAQSFILYTDKPVDISASGETSIANNSVADVIRYTNVKISKIEISATESTRMIVVASSIPNGSPEININRLPANIITGSKTNVSTTASKVTTTSTKINKLVVVKVRSLGTGSYIAFGDSSSQPFRLNAIDQSINIDFVDDLSNMYCVTDTGTTGSIEWIGA